MSCVSRLSVVQLEWNRDTSCTILLNRGTITSWIVNKIEKIFVEMMPDLKPPTPLLGGIQLSFPQHGPWPFGPENGFASTQLWTLTTPPHRNSKGDVEATMTLTDNCVTKSMWFNSFVITNTVVLQENALMLTLEVSNTSAFALRCQVYLVTCLALDDVHVDIQERTSIYDSKDYKEYLEIDMGQFTVARFGLPKIKVENLVDANLGGYLQICCGTSQTLEVGSASRHRMIITWKED